VNRKLTVLLLLIGFFAHTQQIENNQEKIREARQDVSEPITLFFSECLLETDCDSCISELIVHAKSTYSIYLIGGALYNIDSEKSFELHQKAYQLLPNELNFNLEYAMELHRKGKFEDAVPYYLIYKKEEPSDFRIDVWLSECYLNAGEIEKSIEHWTKSNHQKNHTAIDKALHLIHGRTDQLKKRSQLRSQIALNNTKSAYELIYMDLNWERDWWNTTIQTPLLEKDLNLIEEKFGSEHEVYQDLLAYRQIKEFSKQTDKIDSIELVFKKRKFILDGERLVPFGKISSDLIRIALVNKLIDDKTFYSNRKQEVIDLAEKQKDGDLLNIYAYLEASIEGFVSEETDEKGWNDFHDERFAVSYFIGLAQKNKYDNPDLKKALQDFPESAELQWVKFKCAIVEEKEYRADLIELIKKEFKTLRADKNRYSYGLKSYFHILENGI